MSNKQNLLTIVQSVQILYNAVQVGQRNGIYTIGDSAVINSALVSLKQRLLLDDNFQPSKEQNKEQTHVETGPRAEVSAVVRRENELSGMD